MTDKQIRQNANDYVDAHLGDGIEYAKFKAFIAGAHSRDEEINALHDLLDTYERELDKLRNPWISVEERLPEDNKTVLVWFGGYYTVAVLRDNEWWNCTGYQTGGGWSALDKIPDIASSYITHWMPIPELLKGGEK